MSDKIWKVGPPRFESKFASGVRDVIQVHTIEGKDYEKVVCTTAELGWAEMIVSDHNASLQPPQGPSEAAPVWEWQEEAIRLLRNCACYTLDRDGKGLLAKEVEAFLKEQEKQDA